MTFAVVCDLDVACLPRIDRFAGELAGGATTTLLNTRDDQRGVPCVGEVEGVRNHLTLEDLSKVKLGFLEFDFRLLSGRRPCRLRIGHQIGGQVLVAIVMTGKQDHRKASQEHYANNLFHLSSYFCFVRIITAPWYCTTSFRPLHFKM